MGYQRCLVIGGAGMLGYEIARQLVGAGKRVRILDLQPVDDPDCDARVGDIRCREDVVAACEGMDVVFQTAAAVWDVRTPARVYEEVNVAGNRTVVEVCRELGVQRLVYTSTIDVVVDGRRPIVDGDESLPYPNRLPRDPYCRTKTLAEQLVLAANGPELAACALRPVGMYGPRDRYHLGNILAMARRGKYIRLGSGKARFSHVYSENAAHAHILAAEHLFPGSQVAGRAYFVGDHYPAGNLFDFMEPYLEAWGCRSPAAASHTLWPTGWPASLKSWPRTPTSTVSRSSRPAWTIRIATTAPNRTSATARSYPETRPSAAPWST